MPFRNLDNCETSDETRNSKPTRQRMNEKKKKSMQIELIKEISGNSNYTTMANQ